MRGAKNGAKSARKFFGKRFGGLEKVTTFASAIEKTTGQAKGHTMSRARVRRRVRQGARRLKKVAIVLENSGE